MLHQLERYDSEDQVAIDGQPIISSHAGGGSLCLTDYLMSCAAGRDDDNQHEAASFRRHYLIQTLHLMMGLLCLDE